MRLLICAVMLLSGCAVGIGDECSADGDCNHGLVCSRPTGSTLGVCDYPLKAVGEPCTVAAECEAALTCSNHFTPNQRYGTCVAPRGAGEGCLQDRDCTSGTCDGPSSAALGTCQ